MTSFLHIGAAVLLAATLAHGQTTEDPNPGTCPDDPYTDSLAGRKNGW